MPDTGDRRENKRFVNAKEAESVEESNKAVSKTKQEAAKAVQENQSRKRRNLGPEKKPKAIPGPQRDQEASEKMVDEGDPNRR